MLIISNLVRMLPKDLNIYFTKEYIEKVNKHIKICSASLVISEMPVKTTIRYYFTPTKMTIIKKRSNISIVENLEKLESS